MVSKGSRVCLKRILSFYAFILSAFFLPLPQAFAQLEPPSVDPIPQYVSQTTLTLSGTTAKDTSIRINGLKPSQLAPIPYPTPEPLPTPKPTRPNEWSYLVKLKNLKTDGDTQSLSITARDKSGTESLPINAQVTLDQTKPIFSITTPITSGDTIPQTGLHLEGEARDEHFEGVHAELTYRLRSSFRFKRLASYDPTSHTWSLNLQEDLLIPGRTLELYLYAQDQAGNRTGQKLSLFISR